MTTPALAMERMRLAAPRCTSRPPRARKSPEVRWREKQVGKADVACAVREHFHAYGKGGDVLKATTPKVLTSMGVKYVYCNACSPPPTRVPGGEYGVGHPERMERHASVCRHTPESVRTRFRRIIADKKADGVIGKGGGAGSGLRQGSLCATDTNFVRPKLLALESCEFINNSWALATAIGRVPFRFSESEDLRRAMEEARPGFSLLRRRQVQTVLRIVAFVMNGPCTGAEDYS